MNLSIICSKTRIADDDILRASACDVSLFNDNFDDFVDKRAEKLKEIAVKLMNEAST